MTGQSLDPSDKVESAEVDPNDKESAVADPNEKESAVADLDKKLGSTGTDSNGEIWSQSSLCGP